MAYTTTQLILDKVGVTTNEISENKLSEILKEAEAEVDRIIQTTCEPKQDILIRYGNDKNLLYVSKIPLLTVKEVKTSDIEVDIENVRFNQTGQIRLLNTAETQYFTSQQSPTTFIKYFYGWLEQTTITKTTQDDYEAGNRDIELENLSGLSSGRWVRIVGMDGFEENTKIISINTENKTINCDLVYPHESGSLVALLEVPEIVKKLTGVIGALMGALHMVGSTYTFATSYSIPDYSVTKGVPYPHFAKVIDDLLKERDFLLSKITPWPVFA